MKCVQQILLAFWLLVLMVACAQPAVPTPTAAPITAALPPTVAHQSPTATLIAPTSTPTTQPTPTPTTPIIASTATPITLPVSVQPCGVLLPAVLPTASEPASDWQMPYLDETLIPEDALPAVERFFSHPDDVSLAVYRLGYEGVGFYHNADRPMPLASVSKLLQLTAYASQVDAGTLDPAQPVDESDLEQFYLPRSDLNAHRRALAAYAAQPLVLADVVSMMIRYSSNSATDYLHNLLGQQLLEQTAIDLGMEGQSAPCSFIGRFLIMGDGSEADSSATIQTLANDEERYGLDVAARTDRYLNDPVYRVSAEQYWQQRRSPSIAAQTLFVDELETRGTAASYASLMARIVRGEIGSPTSNRQIRDALEWPYDAFESNRELYQMIGYKNGSMPGVLTSVYYSWPLESDQPYVLALFYRNLPNDLYQTWRRELPHDAFAHWLMSDPNALHIMHVWRDGAR